MPTVHLLSPGRIDGFDTGNRMFMAPMTRSRALAGGVPSDLAIEYYAQRASAGLIITEGTAPSAVGLGYARTPSIDTPEQIAAWKSITGAVHARGGRIFMQFMHVGRIAHSANRYISDPPVAPSVVRAAGQMWTDAHGMQDFDTPRALETERDSRRHRGVRAGHAQRARGRLRRRRAALRIRLSADAVPVHRHQQAHRRLRRQRAQPHPVRRGSTGSDGRRRRRAAASA